VSHTSVRPIWTPEDAAAVRQLAEQYPREIGESPVLADIFDREAL
jgi:hypothetical protein